MSATSNTDQDHTCGCADPQVERLRDMLAAGWDQLSASKVLWGNPDLADLPPAMQIAHVGVEARTTVRTGLLTSFPWLRLPARRPMREDQI